MAEQAAPESVSDLVEILRSGRKTDAVLHFLVLTFEFDPSQLVKLVTLHHMEDEVELRQGDLRLVSAMSPLVIYDASKSRPDNGLPQYLEMYPFYVRGFACHHSKAYLAVTDKNVYLLFGSCNLTGSGLFSNREVVESFRWNENQTGNGHLLRQWTQLLQDGYLTHLPESSHTSLEAIVAILRSRIEEWHIPDSGSSRLLASGYGEDGMVGLRRAWDELCPGLEPDSLLVVSPFFDHGVSGPVLMKALEGVFPNLLRLSLFTGSRNAAFLLPEHFGSIPEEGRSIHFVPDRVGDQEKRKIDEGVSGKPDPSFYPSRNLHAKLLLLYNATVGRGRGIVYVGSANFTRKAWLGSNRELGCVKLEDDAATLKENIRLALFAETDNHYAEVMQKGKSQDSPGDDEEPALNCSYPEGLACVRLEYLAETDRFFFSFLADPAAGQSFDASEWEIFWGHEQLHLYSGRSREIERATIRKMVPLHRCLAFHPRTSASAVYWMPYQYDRSLLEDREAIFEWDVLSWLLGWVRGGDGQGNDDTVPFSNDEADGALPEEGFLDDHREENPVVRMQRTLKAFQDLCDSLSQTLDEAAKIIGAKPREQRLLYGVRVPIGTLCSLLSRDWQVRHEEPATVFLLGELLLACDRFVAKAATLGLDSSFAESPARILSLLESRSSRDNRGLERYVEFVLTHHNNLAAERARALGKEGGVKEKRQ